jgi:L-sorbose 1-phosphate reductase
LTRGFTAETIRSLPSIPGGKKLIYPQVSLPLTALEDFDKLGRGNPFFAELARLTAERSGLWSREAEEHLLTRAPRKAACGRRCAGFPPA